VEIMYRSLTFYTNKKVVRVVGYPSARESEKVQTDFFLLFRSKITFLSQRTKIDIPCLINYAVSTTTLIE
jgi:hypothetical protein